MHAYLCTDEKTIAAIILPVDIEDLSSKAATRLDDRRRILSKDKRIQLWQDTCLRHFTWVRFTENLDDYLDFFISLKVPVEQDGCVITFPTLYGGGHVGRRGNRWGNYAEIVSDVARSAGDVRGSFEVVKFVNCKK